MEYKNKKMEIKNRDKNIKDEEIIMNIHHNRADIITPSSSSPAISLLTSAENLSISYALALHRLNIGRNGVTSPWFPHKTEGYELNVKICSLALPLPPSLFTPLIFPFPHKMEGCV